MIDLLDLDAIPVIHTHWRPRQHAGWGPPPLGRRVATAALRLLGAAAGWASRVVDYAAQADVQILERDEQLLCRALLEADRRRRRLQVLLNRRRRRAQRRQVSRDPLAAVTWSGHAS